MSYTLPCEEHCKKCGSLYVAVSYIPPLNDVEECIEHRCATCHYSWLGRTEDQITLDEFKYEQILHKVLEQNPSLAAITVTPPL